MASGSVTKRKKSHTKLSGHPPHHSKLSGHPPHRPRTVHTHASTGGSIQDRFNQELVQLIHWAKIRFHADFSSDPVVVAAFWIAVFTLGISIFFLLRIFLIRYQHLRSEFQRKRFLAVWETLLQRSLIFDSQPGDMPKIYTSEAFTLLVIWRHLHENLKGQSKDRLNQVARWIGLDVYLKNKLTKGGTRHRLLAINAMGYLKEESVWKTLSRIAQGENPVLSLAAMRSMMQIDPSKSLSFLLPSLISRWDWPVSKVAYILREAGTEVICEPLRSSLLSAPIEVQPRVIRYMGTVGCVSSLPTVREVLQTSENNEVISAALQILGQFQDPDDLPRIRHYLHHSQWTIRVQAAVALGKMGRADDVDGLIRLLNDEQWWVRYRAAQALARLPFMTLTRLREMERNQTDRYARNILAQVIAEEEIRPCR